jgi:hypothetical protein
MNLQKNRYLLLFAAACAGVMLFLIATAHGANNVFGPVRPYTNFSNSPFQVMLPTFSYFYLETYEEAGAPTNPGVRILAGYVYTGSQVDSIEFADGNPDHGHSLLAAASPGITFTFDTNMLRGLPTHAGIAWTDGYLPIHFTAYDSQSNSLGTIDDSSGCDYSCGNQDPTHYRFFYATNQDGISAIQISCGAAGGIEVDHLQYGRAVQCPPLAIARAGTNIVLSWPEPGAMRSWRPPPRCPLGGRPPSACGA